MEPSSEFNHPLAPDPAPVKLTKKLRIGLAIGAVVLCLSLVVVVVGFFFLPQVHFPTNSIKYDNPDAGISLSYPKGWEMDVAGNSDFGFFIVFASSFQRLNQYTSSSIPGASFIVITDWMSVDDLNFEVNASSMDQVIEYYVEDIFTEQVDPQNMHQFKMSGLPAASAIYQGVMDFSGPEDSTALYVTVVLRGDEIILMVGLCPGSEWAQQHSSFDKILDSVKIHAP